MVEVVSVGRRMWAAPLWAHVLVLATVLGALVPLMAPALATFSPDEAVVLAQSRSLAGGGGWIVEHPFAQVDPDLRFFPVAGSAPGAGGMAPFAKHPAYPLVLAALDAMGGISAMVLLSVSGTIAAAVLAALLAKEVTGGLERPVLWAVGGGSPLLFDSYLVMAHSLGAALVTGATLAVLRGGRRHRRWLPAVAAASVLVALAVLLRTEAIIFAGALGAGALVAGLVQRRWATVVGGVVVAAAGVVAAVAERWWTRALVETSPGRVGVPSDGGSFASARLDGFLTTWLRPSLETMKGADMALVAVTVVAGASVLVLRGRVGRPHLLVPLGVTATVMTAFAVAADPTRVVPGLVVAYPLAVFGVGLVDRESFQPPGRLVLTVTSAVFIAGVLATQYRVGGSAEWGGRYFALVVPVLTVLAVDALVRRAPAVPVAARGRAVAGLVACSALMAVAALASMHSWHGFYERMLTQIDRAGDSTVAGDGGGPVVVSAHPGMARRGWPTLPHQRWLYDSQGERGAQLAARLEEQGIEELVFVGRQRDDVGPYLGRYAVDRDRSFTVRAWDISTLVRRR